MVIFLIEKIIDIGCAKEIPKEIGVYIITYKNEYDEFSLKPPVYVGSSCNLKSRLYSHRYGGINKDIIKIVDLYITRDIDCAVALESWLISKIKPKYNEKIPVSKFKIIHTDIDIKKYMLNYDEYIAEYIDNNECDDCFILGNIKFLVVPGISTMDFFIELVNYEETRKNIL